MASQRLNRLQFLQEDFFQFLERLLLGFDRTVEFGELFSKNGDGFLRVFPVFFGAIEFLRVVLQDRGTAFGIRMMHGTAQWARRAVNEFDSLVAEAFH